MEEENKELSFSNYLEEAGIHLSKKDQRYMLFSFIFGMYNPNSFIKRINYIPNILERVIPDPDLTRDTLLEFLYSFELVIRAVRKLLESEEMNLIQEVRDLLINTINEVKGDGKINKKNIDLLKERLEEEFGNLINKLSSSNDPDILEGLQILKQLTEEGVFLTEEDELL